MDNKNNKNKIIVVTLIFVFVCICAFIYPSVYEHQCKTRYYGDFDKKITNDILESNIAIVKQEKKITENITSVSWDVGASGVIFRADGDTYYALTAYHVVKDFQNTEYIIIPYGVPTYSEYKKSSESYVSSEMYYEQFEKATIVLIDEEYDLAVISFESKEPLNVLSVSEDNPNTNEKIAVISNPEGERFVYSFGVITSKDYYLFESNDELCPVNTFTHNAYIAPGSSGSAVLNEEMRIVGINIGGGTDFMNRFKYGAMIPCELIHEFFQKNSFE